MAIDEPEGPVRKSAPSVTLIPEDKLANPEDKSICPQCGGSMGDQGCPKCGYPNPDAVQTQFTVPMGVPEAKKKDDTFFSMGPGTILGGKYRILRVLGRGGMGNVYEAEETDFEMGRTVAVKVLSPEILQKNPALNRRFQEEIKILAGVSHPNIVQVYNVGKVSDTYFFVMSLVKGETLGELIDEQSHFSERKIRDIGAQVAGALAHIHGLGIIHRDIKSNNIMVDTQDHATLMDFGIAKDAEGTSKLTASGQILGTGPYMAPEQWDGKCDQRSDIWALGVVLYEMAAGKAPFLSDSLIDLMKKILEQPEPRLTEFRNDLSPALCAIIHKCLAKKPEDRYQNMADIRRALLEPTTGVLPIPQQAATPVDPLNTVRPPNQRPSRLRKRRHQPITFFGRIRRMAVRLVFLLAVLFCVSFVLSKLSPGFNSHYKEFKSDAVGFVKAGYSKAVGLFNSK